MTWVEQRQFLAYPIYHNTAVTNRNVFFWHTVARRTDAFPVKLILFGTKCSFTSFKPSILNEAAHSIGQESIFPVTERIQLVAAPRVRLAMPVSNSHAHKPYVNVWNRWDLRRLSQPCLIPIYESGGPLYGPSLTLISMKSYRFHKAWHVSRARARGRHIQFLTPWSGRPITNVGNPKSRKAPNSFMPKYPMHGLIKQNHSIHLILYNDDWVSWNNPIPLYTRGFPAFTSASNIGSVLQAWRNRSAVISIYSAHHIGYYFALALHWYMPQKFVVMQMTVRFEQKTRLGETEPGKKGDVHGWEIAQLGWLKCDGLWFGKSGMQRYGKHFGGFQNFMFMFWYACVYLCSMWSTVEVIEFFMMCFWKCFFVK